MVRELTLIMHQVSGLIKHLKRIPGRAATEAEITAVHDKEYHQKIKTLSDDLGGNAGDGSKPFFLLTFPDK
jgi:acetoin utilization deacetylase AcuC-like enzyme